MNAKLALIKPVCTLKMKPVFRNIFLMAVCCSSVCVFAQTDSGLSNSPPTAPHDYNKNVPELTSSMANDVLRRMSGVALLRSPHLRDAESGWHAAQMDVEAARGALWPRVDVSGNSKSKMFGTGNPYGSGTSGSVSLTASYTLYDGGKTDAQISEREFQAQSARAKYLQIREQIVSDTVTAYLQILKYRRIVDLHQQNNERLELFVAKMSEIVQAMGGRRSELTQVTARLLQAQDNKAVAEARLREYEIQLLKLVGSENFPTGVGISVPYIEPVAPDIGIATAKKNHPMLLSAEADMLALNASAGAISAENYRPLIELKATKTSGVDIMGYSDPGQMFVAFKWNAFQGFSGRSQEKALFERTNAAQEKYQQIMSEIEYKLGSAWADYNNQTGRMASLKELAVNTEQVRSDYFAQWESVGRRSLLEVLTAESEHVSTMVNLVVSEVDKSLAAAKSRFETGILTESIWSGE